MPRQRTVREPYISKDLPFYYPDDEQSRTATALAEQMDKRCETGGQRLEWDQAMFVQAGIPCVAVTSLNVQDSVLPLTHTQGDTIDWLDATIFEDAA